MVAAGPAPGAAASRDGAEARVCYTLPAMRSSRTAVLAAALTLSLPLALIAPPLAGMAGIAGVGEAWASVSIAVVFDALVKESSAVALVTPVEQRSVWEDGRIYTYTRVRADRAVAGDLAGGAEAWVRTMGGVVGKIGQLVEGEPVLTVGRPSLLFLRPGAAGTLEVTARAQGQFALMLDENKNQRLAKSSAVGVLLPPKAAQAGAEKTQVGAPASPAAPGGPVTAQASSQVALLANEALHDKKLEDGLRDIGAAWKRLHAPK